METTRTHTHAEAFPTTPQRLFALLHTPSAIRGWWGAARTVVLAEPGGVGIALGLAISALLLHAAAPAAAILMRHDRDPLEYERLATSYAEPLVWIRYRDATGTLVAEGTLVADRWVLTAAHVVDGMSTEASVVYRDEPYDVASVCAHPGWTGKFEELHDIALLELATAVPDARPARLYREDDEEGKEIAFVGRGMTGTGLTGPETDDQVLRAAMNRVAEAGPKHLGFVFNAPDSPLATRLEGVSGPGDSGGPALLSDGGALYVLGVSSAQDDEPTGGQSGRYGVLEYYSRVSAFADWIDSVLAGSGSCRKTESAEATHRERLGDAQAPAAESLFAVRFTTGPDWDASESFAEQKHAAEHSANLRRMREEGLIAFGGRFSDTGLIVVRAPDEAAVRSQLARDPSLEAGTFRVAVDEYRPFFAPAAPSSEPAETTEVEVVRRAIAAFNAHDADAFAALCAEDVKWLGVAGDSLSVDGEGRESIREWLVGYFESFPDVRSDVAGLTQAGAHVAFHEHVTWTAGDGSPRAQSALGVYEIRDGAIRRAWYFPSER